MGTTSSVLVLLPQGALAAHVGDSRVYRLRGHTIQQLTFDHSLQWELRASGQMPEGTDIAAVDSQERDHAFARSELRGADRSGRSASDCARATSICSAATA